MQAGVSDTQPTIYLIRLIRLICISDMYCRRTSEGNSSCANFGQLGAQVNLAAKKVRQKGINS